MKIKVSKDVEVLITDDDEHNLLTWLMRELLRMRDQLSRVPDVTITKAEGELGPHIIDITLASAASALYVVPLIKTNPMAFFRFTIVGLSNMQLTMRIITSEKKIDVKLEQARNYDNELADAYAICDNPFNEPKCDNPFNEPNHKQYRVERWKEMYSLVCGDMMRILKGKATRMKCDLAPDIPPMMARLIGCLAIAEPARCLLALPLTAMEWYLGKKRTRDVETVAKGDLKGTGTIPRPVVCYEGSSGDLDEIHNYYLALANKGTPKELSKGAEELRQKMLNIISNWTSTFLIESQYREMYSSAIRNRPLDTLKNMISKKILNHLRNCVNTELSKEIRDPERALLNVDNLEAL